MSNGQDYTLADLCIAACAEAWKDDGEVLASGIGLVPRLAAGLAWLTHSPDLLMTDAECTLVSEPVPVGPRGEYEVKAEGWLPFRKIFELLWSGKRHAMTMPTQIDRFGHTNISLIGATDQPKVQLLGARGIPGNTINHPSSFFVASHNARTFVDKVDMVSGVGHDPNRWGDGARKDFMDLRLVVSNLAVMDFGGPENTMRVRSLHPGATIEQVQENTSFELAVADHLGETPAPTAEQLGILDERLDPHGLRANAVKAA